MNRNPQGGLPPNPNVWGGRGLSTPVTPPPPPPINPTPQGNGLFSGMLNQGAVGGVGAIPQTPQSVPAQTVSGLTAQKKLKQPEVAQPMNTFGGLGMY